GATLVTSLIAWAIRLISARPASGRTPRPFFSCRPATTLNRLALPARSPYPFVVPCTWVPRASNRTRVLGLPQARSALQWLRGRKDVPVVALGAESHNPRARFAQRGDLGIALRLHAGPAGRAERGELRVPEVQFGGGAAEELGVLRDRAAPAALDEPDTELV